MLSSYFFIFITTALAQVIELYSYIESIEKIQKQPFNLATLMIYSSALDNVHDVLHEFDIFAQASKGIIHSYQMDCQSIPKSDFNHLPICKHENKDQLPLITFLRPPVQEYDPYKDSKNSLRPLESKYEGQIKGEKILEASYMYAPLFATILNNTKQFEEFFQKKTNFNKIVLIMEDLKVPLWYHGLTSHFRYKLDFAVMEKNLTDVIENYQTSSLYPDLIIYEKVKGEYQRKAYKGGKRFDSLRAYLTRYAAKEQQRVWQSKFEAVDYQSWGQVHQKTFGELQEYLKKEVNWVMVHFKLGKQIHPGFNNYKSDFSISMRYIEVDCSRNCPGIKVVPSIQIYGYGLKKKKPIYTIQLGDNVESISESLLEHFPPLKPMEEPFLYMKLREELQKKQYVIIYSYESTNQFWTWVGATLLAMEQFELYFSMIFYKDPSEEMQKNWEMRPLPSIIAFSGVNFDSGQHKRMDFIDELNYFNLIKFVYQVALVSEQQVLSLNTIKEASKTSHFDQLCKNKCVIGILNTESDYKSDYDAILKLSINKDIPKDLEYLWIDGSCQTALVKRIKKSQLPAVVYYDRPKNKYLVMNDQFRVINIVSFLQNLKKYKKDFVHIEDDLDLQDLNCQKQREYRQQNKKRQDL